MEEKDLYFVQYSPKAYDYRDFYSGEPEVDDWLARYAGQSEKRMETRTYLLVSPESESRHIYGYIALANFRLLPEETSLLFRKPTRYVLPATRLVKLAVADEHQGEGLGAVLLFRAMEISLEAARLSGSAVMVVDALNAHARGFYERYGFVRLRDDSLRLGMTMSTIAAAF
ncbi:GNAT family N-acetyltransferase [Ancrocorticia populi]|uniref:GNAT family N-acetyltransferase n=1 Tax=Ancrocorticia populi TaxID=2175228 RepID=UPI003F97BBB5